MPWVILVSGAVLILIGWLLRRHHNLVRKACTVQTTGEVIDIGRRVKTVAVSKGRRRSRTRYFPVFRYTAEGQTLEVTSTTGTSWRRFKNGQTITVFYDPNKLIQYYVAEDKISGASGFFLMGFGVILWILELFVIF